MEIPRRPDAISVDTMYREWPLSEDQLDAILDRSRGPKPADSLFDAFGNLGPGRGDTVLDIGARDVQHSLELARRFGCRVVAVEPVAANLANAFLAIEKHPSGRLVDLRPGDIGLFPAVSQLGAGSGDRRARLRCGMTPARSFMGR